MATYKLDMDADGDTSPFEVADSLGSWLTDSTRNPWGSATVWDTEVLPDQSVLFSWGAIPQGWRVTNKTVLAMAEKLALLGSGIHVEAWNSPNPDGMPFCLRLSRRWARVSGLSWA